MRFNLDMAIMILVGWGWDLKSTEAKFLHPLQRKFAIWEMQVTRNSVGVKSR